MNRPLRVAGASPSPQASPTTATITILLTLTGVTGVVDAVSFLGLGHVFVANMTGNVVFLGFNAAGGAVVSAYGAVVALLAFLCGALAGGRTAFTHAADAKRMLYIAIASNVGCILLALALVVAFGASVVALVATALLGLGMGMQNAISRKLAVADLTTTVLTLTLVGLAADSLPAGGKNPRMLRRIGAVAAMCVGAFGGAILVLRVGIPAALALALIALVAAFFMAATSDV